MDGIRGLCLLLMMIFHLPYTPLQSWILLPLGMLPVAEGFVFLAGLASGRSYGHTLRTRGPAAMGRQTRKRAWRIYLAHVLVLALLWIAALWNPLLFGPLERQGPVLHVGGAWSSLVLGILLLYQPTLLDILPMYCLFVLLTPWVLRLLAQGLPGLLAVTGGSLVLWFVGDGWLRVGLLRVVPQAHLGYFDVLSWQLLFCAGLLFGWFSQQTQWISARAFIPGLLLLAAYMALRLGGPGPLGYRTDHHAVTLVRLLVFFSLAGALAGMTRWVRPHWAGPLAYLGRNSLEVFAFSVVVCYAATPLWHHLGTTLQILACAVLLATLYLPAWVMER